MVETIAPGLELHHFGELTSTMDEAALLAEKGAPEGTLVVADHQWGGRGRRGRTWSSPHGNLYMTYLTRPRISIEEAAKLSLVACVGVGLALKSLLKDPSVHPSLMGYKWPNDILMNGHKVAGVLLETVTQTQQIQTPGILEALLIGVGVNVVASPPEATFPATSLHHMGLSVERDEVLKKIALSLQAVLKLYAQEGFEPIRALWMAEAYGLGRAMTICQGNTQLKGIFQGIDQTGALQLGQEDGRALSISAGDVIYGDTHSLRESCSLRESSPPRESCPPSSDAP